MFSCVKENIILEKNSKNVLEESKDGNFILYVSNQSFDINPVDIKIFIDGKLAVYGIFDIKGKRVPQHNWKKFTFKLKDGIHKIKAESKKGKAILEEEFEIKGQNWAVVDYWFYPKSTGGSGPTPKSFTFIIQDRPIGFE